MEKQMKFEKKYLVTFQWLIKGGELSYTRRTECPQNSSASVWIMENLAKIMLNFEIHYKTILISQSLHKNP